MDSGPEPDGGNIVFTKFGTDGAEARLPVSDGAFSCCADTDKAEYLLLPCHAESGIYMRVPINIEMGACLLYMAAHYLFEYNLKRIGGISQPI